MCVCVCVRVRKRKFKGGGRVTNCTMHNKRTRKCNTMWIIFWTLKCNKIAHYYGTIPLLQPKTMEHIMKTTPRLQPFMVIKNRSKWPIVLYVCVRGCVCVPDDLASNVLNAIHASTSSGLAGATTLTYVQLRRVQVTLPFMLYLLLLTKLHLQTDLLSKIYLRMRRIP